MTGRGAESMNEGTDVPVGAPTTSTAIPTDDALPSTRADSTHGVDDGGPAHRARRRPEKPSAKARWKTAAEWGGFIVAALVIAFVVKTYMFQAFYIPSESMVPTLEVGDRVLVNKLGYDLHDVNRGDIVVFEAPDGTRTAEIKDLVKRVVGLPGETIAGRRGQIFIDGKVLDEPWLPEGTQSRPFQCTEQLGCVDGRVPPDAVFVLGDNRLQSKDSTYFGPIKEDGIVGRAFVRIWPIDRLTFIGPSYVVPILVIVALVGLFFVVSSLWSRRRRAGR
ncbi:MAG: signal peptidase I [Acidimicrobiia bacterium]